MSDLKAHALALYKPPFKYLHGYILDSDNRTVADDGEATKMLGQIAARVRGWGRIKYLPSPEELQDKVGELVAEALTQYWERQAQPAEPVILKSVWDMVAGDGAELPVSVNEFTPESIEKIQKALDRLKQARNQPTNDKYTTDEEKS